MFNSISNNLSKIFDKLSGRGIINEDTILEVSREIRICLLEADVALPVVRKFIDDVKSKALGKEVLKSISPGNMVIKIISDELEAALQSPDCALNLSTQPPAVIMLLGLQGSGKTTTSAKLALYLKNKQAKKVLLASLDIYRPAAQLQLQKLADQNDLSALPIIEGQLPSAIAKRALTEAKLGNYDVLILDTAGRLHTDDALINELKDIEKLTNPIEKLLVADALTGQDAVNIANQFNDKVGITGITLTRVDGDSRGGAALSMRYVTNKPIKFLGVGEKPSEFEPFDAKRIAGRILNMGDVVGLVEKAQELANDQEMEALAKKFEKGKFDLNDLLSQLKSINKLGGASKLLTMIPGIDKIKAKMNTAIGGDDVMKKSAAIISSMTAKERRNPDLLNASRRRRIAAGSGTKVEDVNRLLKQYLTMSKMMKKMSGFNPAQVKNFERMIAHGK